MHFELCTAESWMTVNDDEIRKKNLKKNCQAADNVCDKIMISSGSYASDRPYA